MAAHAGPAAEATRLEAARLRYRPRRVGVRRQRLARRRGPGRPRGAPLPDSPGRPARPSDAQLGLLPDFLWHGAEAYGFRGEVWTCGRVAQAIEEEFGVRYHKGHVSRLLKALGWTPQVPITRAIQRDEEAVERWQRDVWPALRRQARREHRTLAFVDEAGFYLLPGLVRTYAPKGLTPVVYEWQTRDHLSVMGAITTEGKVYSLMRQESLNGLHTVESLKHLLGRAGARLLAIWDGSPIHRREARAWTWKSCKYNANLPSPACGRRWTLFGPSSRGQAIILRLQTFAQCSIGACGVAVSYTVDDEPSGRKMLSHLR